MLAVEALESGGGDSVVYSRREGREVGRGCTALLARLCQVDTQATRWVAWVSGCLVG